MRRVLIVGEDGAAARAALSSVEAAGEAARRLSFDEAATDATAYEAADLLLIEGSGAPEALFELVLARAGACAMATGLQVIAAVTPDQIDAAAAQLHGRDAQILCEPSLAERAVALAFSTAAVPTRVFEISREPESAELQRLSEQVARIAERLAHFSREETSAKGGMQEALREAQPSIVEPAALVDAVEIRQVIRARRMRALHFKGELFADPAWDMLLDLFAASLERRRVSVSSLCIAAAVPPTTALRWITTMHEAGLFERQADPADRRRAYVALTANAIAGMRAYAAAVKRAGLTLV